MYRSGWARRVRPGGLLGDPWECLRMFGEVPSQRVKLPFKMYSEIQQLKGLWWGRGGGTSTARGRATGPRSYASAYAAAFAYHK